MLNSFYKKLICVIQVIIKAIIKVLLVLFIVVSVFLCFCSLTRNYEKYETKKLFSTHYDYFMNSLDQCSKRISIFNSERQMVVSDELLTLGISEIYIVDNNTYFELNNRVLWMFPQGILYAKNFSEIPDWYITERINKNWYYYRISS